MAKKIITELIIVLLICLAIILVLGIILYEYAPMGKIIPNQVAYTTSEDVEQELQTSSDIEESQIIMTYEIDNTDLNNYKKIQDYKPGKANPFSTYKSEEKDEDKENSPGKKTNTTSSNSSTTTSGGKFFQDKGTK